MGNHRISCIILILLLALSGLSCRTAADKPAEVVPADTRELSQEEQDKKAIELFQRMFDLLEEADRATVIPKMEAMYAEIIDNYPKAALAHESYWRLILIFLTDYTPPAFEKAELLYSRFVMKYPNSQFRSEIEDTMANMYARHGKWESITKLYSPVIKNYIEKGIIPNSRGMFMYAEAKLKLGDLDEAEKGFRIVMAFFPDSIDSRTAKLRLGEIMHLKSQQK